MDFHVIEHKKLTDVISDSVLQLTFKKLPCFECWCSIKEEYLQLSEKAIKIFLPFPVFYLCEAKFSSRTSTKSVYPNRVKADTDMRTQLSFLKRDIK